MRRLDRLDFLAPGAPHRPARRLALRWGAACGLAAVVLLPGSVDPMPAWDVARPVRDPREPAPGDAPPLRRAASRDVLGPRPLK